MMKRTKWVVGTIALLLTTGCDPEPDVNSNMLDNDAVDDDSVDFTPFDDSVTFRSLVDNGIEQNGFRMNGFRMNGFRMNGFRMNGTVLNSILRLNASMSNLQLTSGSLLSAFDDGAQVTRVGAQLNDMVFNLGFDPLNSGTDMPSKIKIKTVVQSSVQSDVYFYRVENEVSNDVYEPACLDGAGNPVEAIALRNSWDPDTGARIDQGDAITWACRGAALAKAVEWGYRPWVSNAMKDAHEAAVRMIRADYFGDGLTHTTNGNAIDVSDKWGIQTSDTTWPIEAKWGPDGAVCLNTPRKLFWSRGNMPKAASLPYCTHNGLANGTPNTDPSQYGGLLMTRAIPNDNPSAY